MILGVFMLPFRFTGSSRNGIEGNVFEHGETIRGCLGELSLAKEHSRNHPSLPTHVPMAQAKADRRVRAYIHKNDDYPAN
jgi:hypothetical protein